MGNLQLYAMYSPALDRFIVTSNQNLRGVDGLIASKIASTYEYFRYVPDSGITQENINEYLLKNPREICVEITKNCNLHCPVCIANSQISGAAGQLSLDALEKIFKNKSKKNIPRITLTGGEPTLHPEFFEVLKLASSSAQAIILSTNGYLHDNVVLAIKNINNVVLAISLHGTEQIHDNYVKCKGAYGKVFENIEFADSCKKPIYIFSVVTTELLNSLPQICDLLSKFQVAELRLNIIKKRGRIDSLIERQESYESVLKIVEKIQAPFRIKIKRKGQPFLFVNCKGEERIYEQ